MAYSQEECCFASEHHQLHKSNNAFQCGKLWRLLEQNILLLRNWCPRGISKENVSTFKHMEHMNQFDVNLATPWINNWTAVATRHLQDAKNLFGLMLSNENSLQSHCCDIYVKKRMRLHVEQPDLNSNMLDLIFQSCDILILLSRQFNVDPKLIEYDLKSMQYEMMDKKTCLLMTKTFADPYAKLNLSNTTFW